MHDLRKVHVIYPDVIKPALHLHVARGYPLDQNDGCIIIQTRSMLSSTGGACYTLAPINKTSAMQGIMGRA